MQKKYVCFLTLFLVYVAGSVHAEEAKSNQAVGTMSRIAMDMNHRPDSSARSQLEKIAGNEQNDASTRTLAQIMLNMNHRVSGQDKGQLEKIINDPAASKDEKALAQVLMDFNHQANAQQKQQLFTTLD